jgi:hypothetical protein
VGLPAWSLEQMTAFRLPLEGFMQKKQPSSRTSSATRAGRTATASQTALTAAELTKALSGGAQRLPASEEKALRMLHGVGAPRTLVLERVGQDHPEARARLLDIELELLRQSRARAAAAAPVTRTQAKAPTAAPNPKRAKIVAALKAKKPSR